MIIIPGLSATATLAQSDGRTTAKQWEAARAYDRAHQSRYENPGSFVRIGRVKWKKGVLIDFMADVILDAAVKRGRVSQADFDQVAIPKAVVTEHRNEAFQRALVMEPRLPFMLEG
ncbi:hypothetical protein [Rhodoligotrophos ferricapiens]|uniref:hypothetical protein n=1 Tax=Rhodoligotrophos ferricapiens TaxID=3069264 RepID=UPI00315CE089